MCGMSETELQRLGQLIYLEIAKQLDRDPRAIIDVEYDLHAVIVDGSIDLVRVAAAVAKRCCVSLPDAETVEMATGLTTCQSRSMSAGSDR